MRKLKIAGRERLPFASLAGFRIEKMRERQARSQNGAESRVKGEQPIRRPLAKPIAQTPDEGRAEFKRAEHGAFHAEECNLVERIDKPQFAVKLQTIEQH